MKKMLALLLLSLALSGCGGPSKAPGLETDVVTTKAEPFFRTTIEEKLQQAYSEGLNFSSLNYTQVDPMDKSLYTCQNTFEGKVSKKTHTYTARIGYDKETGTATLYYLAIDGKTVTWDEDGEDAFLSR